MIIFVGQNTDLQYIYLMKYINGKDRDQLEIFSLEQAIDGNNEVRLIDVFVKRLFLPAYHPGDLLRLYLYGYLNRIRSSRHLEKECKRNLELMWLLRGLAPDHNTIANFRKDNPQAIQKVFRMTV